MITDKLIQQPAFIKDDQLFLASLRETSNHHFENNDYINFLYKKYDFDPNSLVEISDLEKLPFTMVNLFKHHKFLSVPEEDIVLTLGSSGTSGQKSQIFLDEISLRRVKQLAFHVYRDLGITSDKKYNYLCFTYNPYQANDVGTAFTDELLTNFTDQNEIYYTFQKEGGDFAYQEKETLETLYRFADSPFSTRILGFPAFIYDLILKYDIKIDLGSDSWLQTGGGWKNKANNQISKKEFRGLVEKSLGIPQKNNRDLFGMVEHGIPYVDDESGRLRVPNYARVIIRDPITLQKLPYGQKGLIQFISSYLNSYPSHSLLTSDWGVLNCDNKGEYIEIVGRAGMKKNKGCALSAMEMM